MFRPRQHRSALTAALVSVTLVAAPAWGQSRGELLYNTHCVACHSSQVHWRDKKLVRDWPSLRQQVRQWQATARLEWTDDDIEQVARHLNDTYYRLPAPEGQPAVALLRPGIPRQNR